MRFEAYVAARYLRSKRKNRFVSLITIISIGGVSVGVMALIVVIGVMTGFGDELRKTIIGNRSHLVVVNSDRSPMQNPAEVMEELRGVSDDIVASAPFIEILSVIKVGRDPNARFEFAYIQGVDPELETEVTQLGDNLTMENGRRHGSGELPKDGEIVLGYLLADKLGVSVGDDIAVLTPYGGRATPFFFRPGQQKYLTVSGIAQAQMSEFDTIYGFVNIDTGMMIKDQQGVDGVHIKLSDPFLADTAAKAIGNKLLLETDLNIEIPRYITITWFENQQPFFEALQQEKVVMFIILVFIVLVAAFNITSTLIMVVMEKRRDIGILRTLGVSSESVLILFMIEGLYIGLSGTLLGVAGGVWVAHELNWVAEKVAAMLHVDLFNSTIYYFDHIPVLIKPSDVLLITLSAVALTFLSTLYPAWSAARLNPVDSLRNE